LKTLPKDMLDAFYQNDTFTRKIRKYRLIGEDVSQLEQKNGIFARADYS
jgi:hypothetical protein